MNDDKNKNVNTESDLDTANYRWPKIVRIIAIIALVAIVFGYVLTIFN